MGYVRVYLCLDTLFLSTCPRSLGVMMRKKERETSRLIPFLLTFLSSRSLSFPFVLSSLLSTSLYPHDRIASFSLGTLLLLSRVLFHLESFLLTSKRLESDFSFSFSRPT